MLENYIKEKRENKEILLMTHIVIGYPDINTSYEIVRQMVSAGVDLMELQIPFSEPIADGPVILKANQEALKKGITVSESIDFAFQVCKDFSIPFLFMSYYNIMFKYGVKKFAAKMHEIGLQGAIVPDLPPEEGAEYLTAMKELELDPIFIFSPTSTEERLQYINQNASGFIYCVARRGVTGSKTNFSKELDEYLKRCRKATTLPLAVGFGVKEKADVDFLKGKADIAVVGTETIRIMEEKGVPSIKDFIKSL